MPVPILQTKLHVPALDPHRCVRTRLIAKLTGATTPLWLLSAPAGTGKTTLAADVVDQLDADVAWVSADGADVDPVRFWSHVVAAVRGDDAAAGEVLDRIGPDSIEAAIDELVSYVEALPDRLILVIDDVHHLADSASLMGLGRLVSRPPANLTVVIVTRSDPPLAFSRLRAFGRVTEVRGHDLAFDAHELVRYLGDRVDLDPVDVELVMDRTGGWATLVRAMRFASDPAELLERIVRRSGTATDDIVGFFTEEALSGLDPGLIRFLVDTSILHELTPELCDDVTGRTDSIERLAELVDRQLFIDVIDEESSRFAYHPVFRDVLRRRFDAHRSETKRRLHQRAARHLADIPSPEEAVGHAVAADEVELAVEIIKAHYVEYAHRGQIATTSAWLDALGRERCTDDDEIRLLAAWAALNRQDYDEAERWLGAAGDRTRPEWVVAQELAIRCHRARHLGDATAAVELAQHCVSLIEAVPLERFPSSLAAVFHHARYLDRLDVDVPAVVRFLAVAERDGDHPSSVTGHALLALEAVDRDDSPTAEDHVGRALAFAATPTLERFHQPILALLADARRLRGLGRPRDAQAVAERAAVLGVHAREPLANVLISCERARIAHQSGDQRAVAGHLRDAEAFLEDCTSAALDDQVRATRNATRFAKPIDSPTPDDLSEREYAVLKLLPSQLTRRELARQLYVSENTLKSHLTSLGHKLGATGGRAAIVERAIELHLLSGAE